MKKVLTIIFLSLLIILLSSCSDDSSSNSVKDDENLTENDINEPDEDYIDDDGCILTDTDIQDTDNDEINDADNENLSVIQLYDGAVDIFPATVWDGNCLWITFVSKVTFSDDTSSLQIMLGKLKTDGTWETEPYRISDNNSISYGSPEIAVNGDKIMVVYQGDNQSGERNLNIYMRRFNIDGTALEENEIQYTGSRNGSANDSNAWMPDIAPLGDSNFVLAGAWGHSDANGFQIFVQRINSDGTLNGDAVDGKIPESEEDPLQNQQEPSVKALADETIYVAWSGFDGSDPLYISKITKDAVTATFSEATPDDAGYLAELETTADRNTLVLAYTSTKNSNNVMVKGIFPATSSNQISDGKSTYNVYPNLILDSAERGLITYLKGSNPTFEKTGYKRFSINENSVSIDEYKFVDLSETENAVTLYGVSSAKYGEGKYFFIWTEKNESSYGLYGKFVTE